MSKTFKRSCIIMFIVLFAIVAFFGLTNNIPSASVASAQENVTSNGVQTYAEDSDNYETYLGFVLTNNGTEYKVRATDKTRTEMTIPSIHNGLLVTEIADNGFMSCKNLENIYIPSSVKKIGANAFFGCTALERAYGATAVQTIGNSAFNGCTKLKYFCIYDSIINLGSSVFRNNPNDIYIRMAENQFAERTNINANWATGRASSSQIIYGTEQICEALDETNVDEGYKLIQAQGHNEKFARRAEPPYFYCSEEGENGEFYPIYEIESFAFDNWGHKDLIVDYDNNLSEKDYTVHLQANAFASMPNCVNLKIDVNISFKNENDGVCSEGVFMGSEMLETITMPDVMEEIPDSTFSYCTSLTTLQYKDSTNTNVLSQKISHIGSYAFAQCFSMTEITIPSSVITMGMSVFQDWGTENPNTGETKVQTIHFASYYPPVSTDDYDTWDNDLGEAVVLNFKTITVMLDNQGGIGGAPSVDAMYGKLLTSVEAPRAQNEAVMTFAGYYSEKDGNGTPYYDKDMNCLKEWGKEEIDAGINVLYAYWDKKEMPIKLVLDENTDSFISTTVKIDEKFDKLNEEITKKQGYDFNGFYSERNGGGIQFFDSELNPTDNKYTNLEIDTLYAYWTPIRYQVSLSPNGGSGGTELIYMDYETQNTYASEIATDPIAQIFAPKLKHYTFLGYFNKDDKQYFAADEVDGKIVAKCIEEWDYAENNNLTAKWKVIDYTITYKYYAGDKELKKTINVEELDKMGGSYTADEEFYVVEGIKYSWDSITINAENLANIVIERRTSIASTRECYDEATNTYNIWYPSQLNGMRQMFPLEGKVIAGKFQLMKNIDLSSYSPWVPLPTFKGEFDGNSHTVSGMKIEASAAGNYGLFSMSLGMIVRFTVNGRITIARDVKDVYVGLLCGKNLGTIERCYTVAGSSDSIESESSYAYIGGLVGCNSGDIYNVANRAGIHGKGNIGGIVGKNIRLVRGSSILLASNYGTIYSRVEGGVSIGGIVAEMTDGSIESCSSMGTITLFGLTYDGKLAMPCAGKIVGTFSVVNASYGQLNNANCSIVKEGRLVVLYIGGDIGKNA